MPPKPDMDRRQFLQSTLVVTAAGLWPFASLSAKAAIGNAAPKVVVVGGGYAGATVAKYLRLWSGHGIDVTVVERNGQFVSCPVSNLVLGGSRQIDELTFGYDALRQHHGIRWVKDEVVNVDAASRQVTLRGGVLPYDKLVLAPGVDFSYEQLPGLQSAESRQTVLHAWKAGAQTVALRRQLESMVDGGIFVITVPKMPYRCPPGPYERVCQVAFYLKQAKPKSKIIVLDANPDIVSKKPLFSKAWAELYPGMIEYRPNSSVTDVDVASLTVTTEFEAVKADVLNLIPPQHAGPLAKLAGVVNIDKRWCEVDFLSYESKVVPNVHVIGDAVSAGLPKSAHMATSQARVCAAGLIAGFAGQAADPAPVFANTCYSYITDTQAVHVANVYRYDQAKQLMLPAEGGGISDRPSELEGRYARAWADNIWSDVLT